jgi:hypothetical protein
MTQLKPGLRLKSAVSDVEIMVVKAAGVGSVTCGGVAMLGGDAAPPAGATLNGDGECQVGKRYVNQAGSIEVLCVKGGKGSLAADGEPLDVKASKALPSSD